MQPISSQCEQASGDSSPGDSTFSGWVLFPFLFFFLASSKIQAERALCHQAAPRRGNTQGQQVCSSEGSIRHCWSLSQTQRSLEIGTGGTLCCFKHCKRGLKPTQEFLAITEPFHRAQLHNFTLQRCSRSLRKSLWQ